MEQKRRGCGIVVAVAMMLLGAVMFSSWVWRASAARVDLSYMAVDFEEMVAKVREVAYLSDSEPYNNTYSYAPYRKDAIDANGTKISLRQDGQTVTFDKGLYTHATNNLYYDLEAVDPERKFTHFVAYEGINTTSSGAGCDGVIFRIYGSNSPNGEWQILENAENRVQAQGANAQFVKVDVRGYRYLRLEAHQKGSNAKDHAAWGDAKLVKEDYTQYAIPEIAKYNQDVTAFGEEVDLRTNPAYELTVLRRDFVNKVRQYKLSSFIQASAENRRTLEWVFNDLYNMRWWVLGGEPRGGDYLSALNVLSRIYTKHKADTVLTQSAGYDGLTDGDVYTKLMMSIALTHASALPAWYDSREISDPVRRYEIYKDLYVSDLLEKKVFVRLEVEEMRQAVAAIIGNDEIKWLNNLARERGKNTAQGYNLNPYSYIRYTFGYNYGRAQYYTEESREKWNEKYKLAEFGVPYGTTGKPKLWMVFEEGSVCGGLSKTGSNLWNVFGMPAVVVGQPGHAAYIGMSMDGEGDGWWTIGNDVSGWSKSEKRERFLLGWGSPLMHSGYNVSYYALGQDAMNDFENYKLAEETLMLRGLYEGDFEKLKGIYTKVLEYQRFNLDAWYGLIQLYLGNENTAEVTYVNLAKAIAENMRNYPLPMVKLMEMIQGKIKSAGGIAEFASVQKSALETAKGATKADTKQYASTRTMANYLLGQGDYRMATFSFDGENANKIMLGQRYNDVLALQYQYSLDGGETWETKTVNSIEDDRNVTLTGVEVSKITAENDIKVRIVGALDVVYTIDITQAAVPTNLYANDQENQVMGVSLAMEWREVTMDENGEKQYGNWTSYRKSSPQWTGDVTVQVRMGATGTSLLSEPTEEYHFTSDGEVDEQYSYIPVSHLSVAQVSTEATSSSQQGNATHAIDGNFYTRWHSNWNGADSERYIVVKFDHTVNLSRLEYVSAGGGNGHIKEADIYVSTSSELDMESFVLAGKLTSNCGGVEERVTCRAPWSGNRNDKLPNPLVPEKFDFDEAMKGVNYVMIKARTTSDGSKFVAARMLNFYEDLRGVPKVPTASVAYSTKDYTNKDVLARLVNPSTELLNLKLVDKDGNEIGVGKEDETIRRVDETTVLFKQNGEYKFVFEDAEGLSGQAVVNVNWIDREAPVGRIEYNRGENNPTNQSVTAKLIITNGDTVTVTNNAQAGSGSAGGGSGEVDADGNAFDPEGSDGLVWDPFTYTFENNGEFTFEFVDAAGNKGTATAKVDWIDKVPPKVVVVYDVMEETEGGVVATVLAEDEDEEILITNNGGLNEYRFEENGSFTFNVSDKAGNLVSVVATVDWIKKTEQPIGSEEPGEPSVPEQPNVPVPGEVSGPSAPGVSSGGSLSTGESGGVSGVVGLPEGVKPSSNKLPLSDALKDKFGGQSEYFSLGFVNSDGSVVDTRPESVTMVVDGNKALKAVYLVKPDGSTEVVEYERVDDTHIRLKSPAAGNYLFEYGDKDKLEEMKPQGESVSSEGPGETSELPKTGPKVQWWWFVVAVGVVGMATLGRAMIRNRQR